jgi:hypothetical protein
MFGIHVLTLFIFSTSCAAFECLVSCTELITSITCLQVVQRSLINFDDLSDEILRGLALRPMFERNDDQTFTMREAKKRLHDDTAHSHQWDLIRLNGFRAGCMAYITQRNSHSRGKR